jgi:hypothetical protein
MFGVSELPYLGYIVSREGRKTSPEKVAAVNQAKQPHNLTSLRAFMGLVNYYGVFIPKLATVAAPLHGLMKKDRRWSWGEEEEKAWQKIKKLLSSAKVFCHYNSTHATGVRCLPVWSSSGFVPCDTEWSQKNRSPMLLTAYRTPKKTILNWTKKP